jgi:hypothetical protein
MVYCQKDYEEKHATRCAGCSQYISGTVMHVMEKDWWVARRCRTGRCRAWLMAHGSPRHPTCFKCAECSTPIEDGFLTKNDKASTAHAHPVSAFLCGLTPPPPFPCRRTAMGATPSCSTSSAPAVTRSLTARTLR